MSDLKEKLKALLAEETKAESKEEVKDEAPEEQKVAELKDELLKEISGVVAAQLKDAKKKASEESEEKAAKLGAQLPSIEVREYKKAFYTKKTGEKLFITKSVAEDISGWYKAVVKNQLDAANKKTAEMNTKYAHLVKGGLEPLNETNAGDGGVLVPTILSDYIVDIKDDVAVIRSRAREFPMTGMRTNTLDITRELTEPKVSWGGIEQISADKSTTSATFDKISLTPYTLSAIIAITNQLVEDSPFNMPQWIAEQFGKAIAREEDKVFIVGSGSSQPTGLNSYTPILTVAAGGNLNFQHLIDAFYGMRQGYRDNGVWLMNSSRLALVSGLKDSQNRPIFLPSMQPNIPNTLYGKAVLENNNIGNDTIYYVDLSQYAIAFKDGIRVDTAREATVGGMNMFARNMTAVRAEERLDAELLTTRALVKISNP